MMTDGVGEAEAEAAAEARCAGAGTTASSEAEALEPDEDPSPTELDACGTAIDLGEPTMSMLNVIRTVILVQQPH